MGNPRGSFRDVDCAGISLPDADLIKRISEGMAEIIAGVQRAKARKASLAIQASPLSVVASRRDRRAKAKRQNFRQPGRAPILLTPLARRHEMAKARMQDLTVLDLLLNDDEAKALELWAGCEQLLEGRAPSMLGPRGNGTGRSAPIPDGWLRRVNGHVALKKRLTSRPTLLAVLSAFTAIQNGAEHALSPAQYGVKLFPGARHKQSAFLSAIADCANQLVEKGSVRI